jgi:hypothetical protein
MMASPQAIAIKREAAMGRIEAAAGALRGRFALAVPADLLQPAYRDPAEGHAVQMEAVAAVLEQIVAATAPAELPEDASVFAVADVDGKALQALHDAGYTTLDAVRNASDEELLAVRGIGQTTLERIRAGTPTVAD